MLRSPQREQLLHSLARDGANCPLHCEMVLTFIHFVIYRRPSGVHHRSIRVCCVWSPPVEFTILRLFFFPSVHFLPVGGSTPPGITAPAVPSIPSPIGVNGFTGLPPQANGQPAAEAVFANGIHPYPGKPNHPDSQTQLVSILLRRSSADNFI